MRHRPPTRVLEATTAAAVLLWIPPPVQAQVPGTESGTPAPEAPQQAAPVFPANVGLNLSLAIPQGEFGRNIGVGFGLTGDVSIRLVRSGWLGLRLDGGMLWYGHEKHTDRVYVETIPLDVETTIENTIIQVGIGPQFRAAGYPLNADLYALIGVSRFATSSSAKLDPGLNDEQDVELSSTVYLSDWTPSITLGGELNWTFEGDREGFLVGIGIGLEYRRHGTTRYLREGSITQLNGGAVFEPLESRADFWVIRIGLRGGYW